jgi:hypothetical protein
MQDLNFLNQNLQTTEIYQSISEPKVQMPKKAIKHIFLYTPHGFF